MTILYYKLSINTEFRCKVTSNNSDPSFASTSNKPVRLQHHRLTWYALIIYRKQLIYFFWHIRFGGYN